MSIFKDSFNLSIQDQISLRQKALTNRTSKNLTYYNSRNAWIRLSSSVNIYKGSGDIEDENNYTNDLAKKYILQGGILNESISGEGQLREGIGDFSKAYSTNTSDGRFYRLGIRPMPGIIDVDIKSKGAYGSLREATIKFQCWDIKQLEDLELLYMRPGYSLLLEWGWSPYLDNKEGLNTTVQYGDIINSKPTKELLFKQQYAKATDGKYKEDGKVVEIKGYEGNYDSMYGFIKNYSWKARPDGGYDCQTNIISMGEIIESLKVNYSPFDNISKITSVGLLSPNLQLPGEVVPDISKMNLSSSYAQNILAGLFEEMYKVTRQIGSETSDVGEHFLLYDKQYKNYYDVFHKTINIRSSAEDQTGGEDIGKNDEQIYVTLEGLTRLINNYVLLKDQKADLPFAGLSVFEGDAADSNAITGKGYLLGLAHPLQLSIDPTVCLIKNKLWSGGIKFNAQPNVPPDTGSVVLKYGNGNYDPSTPDGEKFWTDLVTKLIAADGSDDEKINNDLIQYVQKHVGREPNAAIEELKEIQRNFLLIQNGTAVDSKKQLFNPIADKKGHKISEYYSFYDLLDEGLNEEQINKALTFNNGNESVNYSNLQERAKAAVQAQKIVDAATQNPEDIANQQIAEVKKDLDEKQESLENLAFLDNLKRPYFIDDGDYKKELGIIGNIYVNLGMLYNMCASSDLAAQDTKEKNDIALYDFMKNVLKKISTAIGEVNNFELFIDPNTNLAKIIDINYVDRNNPNTAYKNAFEIQVQNTNSIVRSYNLESQIFQDQSTMIAIGAQAGGGALAADTTTLTAYNKRIIDRIIPKKTAPSSSNNNAQTKFKELFSALDILFTFINRLKWNDDKDSNFDLDENNKYKNALKDIINYFKTIGKSKTKSKAIIPTKLSLTMDGIGGIIIGNIFKIPDEVLPRGYKGGDVGARLGYIVTEIGHSISNNDWTTNLTAQTIILEEDNTGIKIDYENITIALPVYKEVTSPAESSGTGGTAETKSTTPTPSGVGNGCKAVAPDVSSIKDSELDIIKGSFTTNTGTVNELAVVDGKPVGKDVAKAIILMKRAAAKDGVDLRVNSGFRSPYTTIGPNGPIQSTKGTSVSSTSQDTLYSAYLKNGKPLTAKPGTSNHGNAFAFDLNTGSVTGTIKSPLNKKVYQWLIDNAHKYGFVRWVAKEEWHWEYRPGEYQYNQRVPRDNKLYAGMKTDSPCG